MAGIPGNKGGSGRPRKPRALKLIQGTLQPCRDNPEEPQYPEASLEPPIALTGGERKRWDHLAPLLIQVRVLTEPDRDSLARYCILMELFVSVRQKVKRDPDKLDMLLKLNVQLRGLESDFGLTPASRSRIHAAPVEKEDAEAKREKKFFG